MILLFPISFVIYGLEEKINVGKADFGKCLFCPLLEVRAVSHFVVEGWEG